jgi:energy-coupling factor transport system ATP-binding protein
VHTALRRVGLDPESCAGRSPFTLSWGEKRLVALAGVLVLATPRLALDEPGAGLDPAGRRAVFHLLGELAHREGRTVIVVSHHLEDLFRIADRIAILSEGRIAFCGTLQELTRDADLESWGLSWPPLLRLLRALAARRPGLQVAARTPEEALEAIRGQIYFPREK